MANRLAMSVFKKHACLCKKSACPGCCPPARSHTCACLYCTGIRNRGVSETNAKATPLPWRKLIVVCAVLFVSQFGITMIFPFLPFMVHDFFPELEITEIGQKAGYLGCAYYVGNLSGSLLWGWLSDIVGRRPIMLTGMLGIILSELLFAFSQNFVWAVAARLSWGFLNGNLGLAKTYISEICDDSNQAKGFAIIGASAGVGNLLGSAVGGFLAQPALKYPSLQLLIFCEYPYSFPVLVGAGMGFCSLIVAWLFLDETLHQKKGAPSNQETSEEADESSTPSQGMADSEIEMSARDPLVRTVNVNINSDNQMVNLHSTLNDEDREQIEMVAESDMDTDSDFERVSSDTNLLIREREWVEPDLRKQQCPRGLCFNPLFPCLLVKKRIVDCVETPVVIITYLWSARRRDSWSPSKKLSRVAVAKKARSALKHVKETALLMVDRRVFLGTSLYGLFVLIAIMGTELLPLLLVTTHLNGGYNMDDSEIGVVWMVTSIIQLMYQVLLFPRITRCIGYRNTFRLSLVVFAVACFLLPFSNQITGPIPSTPLPNDTVLDDPAMSGDGIETLDGNYCNYTLRSNATSSNVNENSVLRIPIYVWVVLVLDSSLLALARITCITATIAFTNNASLPATKGTVNGIGQSLAAIGQAVGTGVGTPVFAWSEGLGLGWPLNFHFVFDLMGLTAIGIIFISCFLPKSIEKKRKLLETSSNSTSTRTRT